jgi:hypothetical protein
MERIGRVHPFSKRLGLAAPQIGIGRAAAVAQPPAATRAAIVLLNPRITAVGEEMDEQVQRPAVGHADAAVPVAARSGGAEDAQPRVPLDTRLSASPGLLYGHAPYGVGGFVAVWTPR